MLGYEWSAQSGELLLCWEGEGETAGRGGELSYQGQTLLWYLQHPGAPVPAGLTEKGVEVRGVHYLAQDCTAKCLGQDSEKNGEEGKSHVGVSMSGCSRVRLIIL